jgi:ubiquinone biosynthesis protein
VIPRRQAPEAGFKLRISGAEAVVRIGQFAMAAAWRHAVGRLADGFVPRSRQAIRQAARRETTVRRAVALLGRLKGAFVKAGQFASVRHDLVSEGAAQALVSLQSRVPPLPFATIRRTVESELGAGLDDLFEEFEVEPLGAASVAQVHRARLPSGESVAVKVQYPWLRASLGSDLALLQQLVRAASWWSGRQVPDREALFGEFRQGLLEELDFEREGRAAAEIAANLSDDPQIAVPRIVSSHSSPRVLTMSYCDAIPISDRAALDARGISRREVLEVLGRAYAKQIFADGLFHADPHPGNLFVVDEDAASTKPRVLFVDFGLCKQLSPALRDDLRRGIYALLQSDLDAFIERMDAMGMIAAGAREGVREAVGEMFERIRLRGGALGLPGQAVLGLKDEAKDLLRNTPGLQLPNDLLLYARTLSYLFALGDELAPEVDLVKLSTPHLLRFLAEK